MSRVLQLTFVLLCSLFTAVFGVRLAGRAQFSPLALLMSSPDRTPCERPCPFGIQPGETPTSQALALLKEHPSINGLRRVGNLEYVADSQRLFPGTELYIALWETSSAEIGRLRILSQPVGAGPEALHYPFPFTLGDVADVIGVPESLEKVGNHFIYFFRNDSIVAIATDLEAPWSLTNRIDSIYFSEPSLITEHWKWCGFRIASWERANC